MNYATLLAFRTYFSAPSAAKTDVHIYWHCECQELATEIERMLSVLTDRFNVRSVRAAVPAELANLCSGANGGLVVYASDSSLAGTIQPQERLIRAVLPTPDDPACGLWHEICTHDYALGGLNEWIGQNDQFCAPVLQHLSLAHCRRSFPMFARRHIDELYRGRSSVDALDVGCGPISRLRWGAVEGRMHITGVDPLNDLYDAIIARHGLSLLPKLRPDCRLQAFAETLSLQGQQFDLVFSYNALDHTQNIEKAFSLIRDALRPDGAAVISMHRREGERQKYEGLHRYNCWLDGGSLLVSERQGNERDLLNAVGGLSLAEVLIDDERMISVLLRHA